MNITIRRETESDIDAISEITKAAFQSLQVSNDTEQFIINALREAKALTICLVAEADDKVAGHIAFSPVTISDGSRDWYGLGPISVSPELQKQGIGESLIQAGLSALTTLGGKGCVLVGHPSYYRRFGFRNLPDLVVDGVPSQYVFALPFDENTPHGTVVFHEGFAAKGGWRR